MAHTALLDAALVQLRGVVQSLSSEQMDTVSNCEPWTVRRLASHALNNQLLWAGVVTGHEIVSVKETMGAVPHEGDLAAYADHAVHLARQLWDTTGVLEAIHPTPFGELPGSVVIDFPTSDAFAHAWDLAASVGRAIEFPQEVLPEVAALFKRVCTDMVREVGLLASATEPPADATETERCMAQAGRRIPR